MNSNNDYTESVRGSADSLDPSIASENDTEDDSDIISNMTYSDYLSAVYSYEDKAGKKANYDRKIMPLKHMRDTRRLELQTLEESAENNRAERKKIHDDAVNEQKDKWQKIQDRLDVQIAQEVGRAKQQAEAEVNRKKEEYLDEVSAFNDKVSNLKCDIFRLENERKEIEIYRNKYDDYSIDFSPVADEGVLELLETARDKHWLTPYHKELLKMNADKVCEKRIQTFEELEEREREFAGSKMVEDIRKGEVTREVIKEFAKRSGIVCGVVFALFGTIAQANPTLAFFAYIQAFMSCVFWGGMSFDISRRIAAKKFPKKKQKKKVNLISIGTCVLGSALGFLIWTVLFAGNQSIFALVYTLLSAVGMGIVFKQIMLAGFMEKYLKKLPFLKDRARYYVFKNASKAENGKYNLQIYCYLNHNLVLHYLSIKHKDEINADIENKLELNRNLHKKDRAELTKMAAQKNEILLKRQKFKTYVKQRKAQLIKEIHAIESRRGSTDAIDFESKLPQNVSSELIRLDAEYEDLQVQIENTILALKRAEEHYNSVRKKYENVSKEYTLIEEALRYWYKTPTPSATDYSLLDALCFESKNHLSIIHHNLQPFAFRYTVRNRGKNPSESLKVTIFKYIRGLIKINPCRMLQINIVDPVSDPQILLGDDRFKRLSSMGVISGVYSVSDFEIRLFSNERAYNTFRSIFKTQCIEIQKVLSRNSHRIQPGEPYSLELANRIRNDENEPFMYQIMMFVVPREFDRTSFDPPLEIVKSMENGTYLNMGILPVFFVDNDSIHKKWRRIVEMCPEECIVRKSAT